MAKSTKSKVNNLGLLINRNPDVLNSLANLSNDEVFSTPELANKMLDDLEKSWADQNSGEIIWSNSNLKFLDPFTKSGVFLREITKRLIDGLEGKIPDLQKRVDHILGKQIFGEATTNLTALVARRSVYCSKLANGEHSIASVFADETFVARGPNSYPIEFIEVEESKVIETADDVIERLTDKENWLPGEIALLTTKNKHPVQSEFPKDREAYWAEFWNGEDVFYGTVGGFKGLERSVVVLAVDGFHNAEDYSDFMYVGLTRARDKLVIVGDKELKNTLKL